MQALKEALSSVGTQFTATAGVFATVTGIFLYHVLAEKTPECTCKDQTSECRVYMALPIVLIIIMSLWLDGSFQRVCKHPCPQRRGRFCSLLLPRIFRAVFISLLWPLSVLLDGDWYVCCIDDRKLACKNETTLTDDDRISIKELRNKSKLWGLGVLFVLTAVAAIITSVPWKRCCSCCESFISSCMQWIWDKCVPSKCKQCCSCCGSNESNCVLLEKIVLEEGENLVTEWLKKAAKDKLNTKLDEFVADEDWDKFYDVVKELIGVKVPSDEGQSESSNRQTNSSEKDDASHSEIEMSERTRLLSKSSSPKQRGPPPSCCTMT